MEQYCNQMVLCPSNSASRQIVWNLFRNCLFELKTISEGKWSSEALSHGVTYYYNEIELLGMSLILIYHQSWRERLSKKELISIFSYLLMVHPFLSSREASPNMVSLEPICRSIVWFNSIFSRRIYIKKEVG